MYSLLLGAALAFHSAQPVTPATPPGEAKPAEAPYPVLVTDKTRADAKALAELEKPGKAVFTDGFDSEESFKAYYEVGGQKEGNAKIVVDPGAVHAGKGSLRLTSPASGGKSSGASAHLWLPPLDKEHDGYERLHIRYYIRYAEDYDQGNLNHTGGSLAGAAGSDKWAGMGGAGLRPKGDDDFSSRVEGWTDWKRVPPPGALFCYVYWMDMKIDKDGHYWGNMMKPAKEELFTPQRGKWYCVEEMIKLNTVRKADGELAVWIDGKLYLHCTGFRWRSTEALKIKRASLIVYVHAAEKDNTVWYDDFAVSTGYIGLGEVGREKIQQAVGDLAVSANLHDLTRFMEASALLVRLKEKEDILRLAASLNEPEAAVLVRDRFPPFTVGDEVQCVLIELVTGMSPKALPRQPQWLMDRAELGRTMQAAGGDIELLRKRWKEEAAGSSAEPRKNRE